MREALELYFEDEADPVDLHHPLVTQIEFPRPGVSPSLVPLHRELARGTLGSVLRQAGLSAAEFLELLS